MAARLLLAMCLLAEGTPPCTASAAAEAEQVQCPAQCPASAVQCPAEGEWRDTPLLASMWEAISSGSTGALDEILDLWGEYAVNARSSDGRGLAFWGFEFKSAYTLGAVLAYGGDLESSDEDVHGSTASSLCDVDKDCDRAKLVKEAKGLVADIKKRRDERADPCVFDLFSLLLFRLLLIFWILPAPSNGTEALPDAPALAHGMERSGEHTQSQT